MTAAALIESTPAPALTMLPVTHVFQRQDIRKIDEKTVTALMGSIRDVGIISPLKVRAKRLHVGGILADAHEILAGVHRFTAAKRLGLKEVLCDVVEVDDLHADLITIDENLCRTELTPSSRAKLSDRRKTIYEELHPETGHGGDRKSSRKLCDLNSESFVANTARVTGVSERSVQLNVERGEKIRPEVLKLIELTPLDTGAFLDMVKKVAPEEQEAWVKRELEAPRAAKEQKPAQRAQEKADKVQARAERVQPGDANDVKALKEKVKDLKFRQETSMAEFNRLSTQVRSKESTITELNRQLSNIKEGITVAAGLFVKYVPRGRLDDLVADLTKAGHKTFADQITAMIAPVEVVKAPVRKPNPPLDPKYFARVEAVVQAAQKIAAEKKLARLSRLTAKLPPSP